MQAARSLWHKDQHAEALVLFAEAMRQEPNNVRTYIMAARACAESSTLPAWSKRTKNSSSAPRHPGVHHYIGETFNLLKLPDRAMLSFEQAARLPGGGGPTWTELASL